MKCEHESSPLIWKRDNPKIVLRAYGAESKCYDPEDDREGEPERRRPCEQAKWVNPSCSANSAAHVPKHRPSREKDMVQRSKRFPSNPPFSFFLPIKSVYNCIRLFRGFLSYLQESPLQSVRSLDIYIYIYCIGASYTNNGLRKRACALNLSPPKRVLFHDHMVNGTQRKPLKLRVNVFYRSPTECLFTNTRSRSHDPSDPVDRICQTNPLFRRVVAFRTLS